MTPLNQTINFKLALLVAMTGSLIACGNSDSKTPPEVPASTPAPIPAPAAPALTNIVLTAQVFNALTGVPLANAKITGLDQTVTTDATGYFSLKGTATTAGRTIIQVQAAGYINQTVIVNLVAGQVNKVAALQISPITIAGKISANVGGTLSLPNSPAQITITANSLVRVDGQAIVGNVSVGLVVLDTAQDLRRMPGELMTLDPVTNTATPIESFGAIAVVLVDETGAALQLITGQRANVRIPVNTRGEAPSTSPLYYFDAITARWILDGTLTLVSDGSASYYTGSISRIAPINADRPYTPVSITGCLEDEKGVRVANGSILLEGVNYSGYSVTSTNANGEFSIAARPNSNVIVSGQQGTRITNTAELSVAASNTALPTSCLALSQANSNVKIRLSWGNKPEDLDTHLFTPNNEEIDYTNQGYLNKSPFVSLDVDDTDSFGPEITTIRKLMVGTYRYMVYNYSGTKDPAITGSPARVELNLADATQIFVPPVGEGVPGSTDTWHVFNFVVANDCKVTVVPVQKWITESSMSTQSNSSSSTTPVYCTPTTN